MKKLFSLLLNTCILFGACTDDVKDITQNGSTPLAVNVKVNPASRAIVYGTALPSGSSIGINVTDANGNPYDGKDAGYLNVQYTVTGEAGAQEWGATTPVLLSGTEGKMHAYYPWTTGVDYKAVTVDVADQIDWMYAADAYTVSDAKANAEITLAHAQTALNVNLVRDASYTGIGKVEALTVTSEGLAGTATLDTRDGSFKSVTGANTAISIIEAPYTLDGTALNSKENPYMFIPASTETKDFNVSATLDGKEYSHKVTMSEAFTPGKVYKINVTFKNTGLEVSTVTLVDWVETGLGDAEFKPVQTGTNNGYTDGVLLKFTFPAAPEEYVGTEVGVQLLCCEVEQSMPTSKAAGDYLFSLDLIEKMYINGEEVAPQRTYSVKATTESQDFEIKYVLKDPTHIPDKMFYAVEGPISIVIPNSVTTIGEYAFGRCKEMTSVTIGSGVQTIGAYAFAECEGLTSITIPESVSEINWGIFILCI